MPFSLVVSKQWMLNSNLIICINIVHWYQKAAFVVIYFDASCTYGGSYMSQNELLHLFWKLKTCEAVPVFSFQVFFCILLCHLFMRHQDTQKMGKIWCNFFFPTIYFLSDLPLWVWDQKHPPKSWWICCLKENCMGRILLWLHVINSFWVSLKCSQGKVSISHLLSWKNRSVFQKWYYSFSLSIW